VQVLQGMHLLPQSATVPLSAQPALGPALLLQLATAAAACGQRLSLGCRRSLWRRPFRKPCVYPSQDLRTS
jgi:hypothetical protein